MVELRVIGVALAIGLDVLALSVAVGTRGLSWPSRLRLGAAFAFAEIAMQILGYVLGTGFGRLVGVAAEWIGLIVLGGIGVWILREGFSNDERQFDVEKPLGLVVASLSISIDSLGVGFALPALRLPLMQLFATVAVSTVCFTLGGLAFGQLLGQKFGKNAERAGGVVLILLAIGFLVQQVRG